MSQEQIVRAWKNQNYREGLSETQRSLLPAHPAGLVELLDADSDGAAGGMSSRSYIVGTCSFFGSYVGTCC